MRMLRQSISICLILSLWALALHFHYWFIIRPCMLEQVWFLVLVVIFLDIIQCFSIKHITYCPPCTSILLCVFSPDDSFTCLTIVLDLIRECVCVCIFKKFLPLIHFDKLGLSVKCLWNVIVSFFCIWHRSLMSSATWLRVCVCACVFFAFAEIFCVSSVSFSFHFNKGRTKNDRHKTNLNYCRYFCRARALCCYYYYCFCCCYCIVLRLLFLSSARVGCMALCVLWLLANICDNQNGKRGKIVCTKAWKQSSNKDCSQMGRNKISYTWMFIAYIYSITLFLYLHQHQNTLNERSEDKNGK